MLCQKSTLKDLKGSYTENAVLISNDAEQLQMRNLSKMWGVNLPTLKLHLLRWITRGMKHPFLMAFKGLRIFFTENSLKSASEGKMPVEVILVLWNNFWWGVSLWESSWNILTARTLGTLQCGRRKGQQWT